MNPHGNVTADGVLITEGLRVVTNELEWATVVGDDTSEAMCCANTDHTKAQIRVNGGWFTDHPGGARAVEDGCYCRHDHWFKVANEKGTKMFNGERLATRMPR